VQAKLALQGYVFRLVDRVRERERQKAEAVNRGG